MHNQAIARYQLDNEYDVPFRTFVKQSVTPQPRLFRGAVIDAALLEQGVYKKEGISSWTKDKNIAYDFADKRFCEARGNVVPVVFILDSGAGCEVHNVWSDNIFPECEEVLVVDEEFSFIDVQVFEEDEYDFYEIGVVPAKRLAFV